MDASSACRHTPTGEFRVNAWKSRLDPPGATGVYDAITCCHDDVSAIDLVTDPWRTPLAYSRMRSLSVSPGASERAQMLALYAPACRQLTLPQPGSSSPPKPPPAAEFETSAAQPPECPPATRLSVLADASPFQPDVS